MNEVAAEILRIFGLALIPVTEYQLAIPVGIARGILPAWAVFLTAVIGGFLPFFPAYYGLSWFRDKAEIWLPTLTGPIDRFVARAEASLRDDYEKYGSLAVFIAMVIPFPFTGLWTLTVAAAAFKIPMRWAALGIFFGMLGGGGWITLVSMGVVSLSWFSH